MGSSGPACGIYHSFCEGLQTHWFASCNRAAPNFFSRVDTDMGRAGLKPGLRACLGMASGPARPAEWPTAIWPLFPCLVYRHRRKNKIVFFLFFLVLVNLVNSRAKLKPLNVDI